MITAPRIENDALSGGRRLAGRIAIVTGAARGIGAAIARRFAAEGASVVCIDQDDEVHALARDIGAAATPIMLDVTDTARLFAMVDAVHQREGRIDILVNNAGIDGTLALLADSDEADLDAVLNVNLRACWASMRSVLPIMVKQGSGAVVNISSTAALMGFPRLGVYSASKAAVLGMTRTAAIEYGRYGIRINALCPGGVMTGLAHAFGDEAVLAQWAERHALRRFAEPAEIAGVTAFLASDDASFITGAAIPVDGGLLAG